MGDLKSCRSALCGWVTVMTIVVGYDVWALLNDHETLSGAFWRARKHRHIRYLVLGVWGALTWHLVLGDKQLVPTQMSAAYRRNHPIWAMICVLKAHAPSSVVTARYDVPVPPVGFFLTASDQRETPDQMAPISLL